MVTAHNAADVKDIANVVLMPGDPLRAKYIADTYLEDVVLFNEVRNMYGYTGTYRGKRISVMGSGMGCGSMGIYSHELFNKYDVDVILRVGSCGAYTTQLNLLDVLVVDSSWSESTYANTYSGVERDIVYPDHELCNYIQEVAHEHQVSIKVGRIHTSDCFYHKQKEDFALIVNQKNCVGVDMESFALFHNAAEANKKAATLLTVSDHCITKEKASSEAREQNFNDMIQLALLSVLKFA